jgi:hypothetical protein
MAGRLSNCCYDRSRKANHDRLAKFPSFPKLRAYFLHADAGEPKLRAYFLHAVAGEPTIPVP